MNRKNPKFKLWAKRRADRKWRKSLKRTKARKTSRRNKSQKSDYKKFNLPTNFSLINNFDEVVKRFKEIEDEVTSKKFTYKKVYLDMSKTTQITVDALMYLLVFIKNMRSRSPTFNEIRGNLPINPKCAKLVQESGFLNYLKSNRIVNPSSDDNVQIYAGDKVESREFGEICLFIHKKLHCNIVSTKKLYCSLGEIVGNSNEHAYTDNVGWKKWLVFARYHEDRIRIVILDTGLGIITTMKKKLFEESRETHAELLKSAIEGGNFRSKTKKGYRNKGLPSIRNNALAGTLKNLVLITNDVKYTCIPTTNKKESYEMLNNSLAGTLYYFEFGGLNNEKN